MWEVSRPKPSPTRRHVLRAAALTAATGGLALAGVTGRRAISSHLNKSGGAMSTPFLDDPLGRLAGGVRSLLHHPADGTGSLPDEGPLPSFSGATGWLNTDPLTPDALRGRVVLIDFWTYTCVNWLRTLPYVRAWVAKYAEQGLTVVGVHTPEFDFEHDVDNIRTQARALRVPYPIAIDSDYGVWNAYDNHYWPAIYIADAQGRIRYHHFGEGEYAMQEMVIQQLLLEAGATGLDLDLVTVQPVGLEVAADYRTLRSPETYLGYGRGSELASPDGLWADIPHHYTPPSGLRLNEWSPTGEWTISQRAATSTSAGARLAFRFGARDVNLVMGPATRGAAIPFRVTLDGKAASGQYGVDIEPDGAGVLREQRTYQLIRQLAPITERVFEIKFLEPGAELYCFTFG
jgi:thiol-disulfide isomerase/thioredoxin